MIYTHNLNFRFDLYCMCSLNLRHATPCYAMLHHGTPCYAMVRDVTRCYAMLRYVPPCYVMYANLRHSKPLSRVSYLIRLTTLPFVACITSYLTISLGTSHPHPSCHHALIFLICGRVVCSCSCGMLAPVNLPLSFLYHSLEYASTPPYTTAKYVYIESDQYVCR